MIYEKEYVLDDSRCDAFGQLKLSALLAFFQDIAGCQCARWAMDWQTLWEKGLFWAVSRNRVVLHRRPKVGERVRLVTWPVTPTRTAYPRALEVYDSQGELVAQAMSLWVLMDTQKRTMVLPGKSNLQVPGITRGCELPLPASLPPVLGEEQRRKVLFSDLDRNGHMSNTRYLDWAMDAWDAPFWKEHPIGGFRICYLQEAREGQVLVLRKAQQGLALEAVEESSGKRVFAIELEERIL